MKSLQSCIIPRVYLVLSFIIESFLERKIFKREQPIKATLSSTIWESIVKNDFYVR